jgi:hypothetical protein
MATNLTGTSQMAINLMDIKVMAMDTRAMVNMLNGEHGTQALLNNS